MRDLVAGAVSEVAGLSLLVPLRKEALRLRVGGSSLAVRAGDDLVEVRLVAHRLPLPPLLQQAGEAARRALAGTGWERVPLRLVVAELTVEAFDDR